MYPIVLELQAAGIPCRVKVFRYKKYRGNYSSLAIDPDEYYGWTELDYRILDRKGYKADWLVEKLERENLLEEFVSNLQIELDDYIQGEYENYQDLKREEQKLIELRSKRKGEA